MSSYLRMQANQTASYRRLVERGTLGRFRAKFGIGSVPCLGPVPQRPIGIIPEQGRQQG